jgi:hypothetical protein
MRIIWLAPLFGSLIGFFFLLDAVLGTHSAPQQAAEAALACASGVLPYVFARAVREFNATPATIPESAPATEPSPRPVSLKPIGRVLLYLVGGALAIMIIGKVVDYIPSLPSGPGGPEAQRACNDFKPTYDTLVEITPEQRKMAINCRERLYWPP